MRNTNEEMNPESLLLDSKRMERFKIKKKGIISHPHRFTGQKKKKKHIQVQIEIILFPITVHRRWPSNRTRGQIILEAFFFFLPFYLLLGFHHQIFKPLRAKHKSNII